MENQRTYWSRFINQRLEKLGPGKIDLVLKDIAVEQEMCRRNTHYLLAEFKKWDPTKEVDHEQKRLYGTTQKAQR